MTLGGRFEIRNGDVWKIKDIARLKADVIDLSEIGFQDIDHEFLFEPEMDGIDTHGLAGGFQHGLSNNAVATNTAGMIVFGIAAR